MNEVGDHFDHQPYKAIFSIRLDIFQTINKFTSYTFIICFTEKLKIDKLKIKRT